MAVLSENKKPSSRQSLGILKRDIQELTVSEIATLEQATEFITKRDVAINQNYFLLAHALKKVRDDKLYEEKYLSFTEYYTNELNYSRRSIYNYLTIADNLPLDTPTEVINAGVRKVLALANPDLDDDDRQKYLSSTDISGKSSEEIKQDVKDIIEGNSQIIDVNYKPVEEVEEQQEQQEQHQDESNAGDSGTISLTVNTNNNQVSISKDEVKTVNRFYSKFDTLYTKVEKFKEERSNEMPIDTGELSSLKSLVDDFKSVLARFEKLLRRYVSE